MEKRQFGSTQREVAVIGQGTWYIESQNRASVMAALRQGLDLGMNHIDTAEMYGSGAAEEIIGEAITGRREEVFPGFQSSPRERLAERHHTGMRELARPTPNRLAGLLSLALAWFASAGGHDCSFRRIAAGWKNSIVGREQLRYAGS